MYLTMMSARHANKYFSTFLLNLITTTLHLKTCFPWGQSLQNFEMQMIYLYKWFFHFLCSHSFVFHCKWWTTTPGNRVQHWERYSLQCLAQLHIHEYMYVYTFMCIYSSTPRKTVCGFSEWRSIIKNETYIGRYMIVDLPAHQVVNWQPCNQNYQCKVNYLK